jgi:hypothetical protein
LLTPAPPDLDKKNILKELVTQLEYVDG